MYYYYYNKYYSSDILVYIEEINLNDNYIIFDFFDSNEFQKFSSLLNLNIELSNPSMVILKNYHLKKKILENTLYSISIETLSYLREDFISTEQQTSFLYSFSISLPNSIETFFKSSVSLNEFDRSISGAYTQWSDGIENLQLNLSGKITANIRNVGQGNWNEILKNDQTIIVYDIGAPVFASKADVKKIIDTKPLEYASSKPCLFLSHWDKDHYHCLLGMTDEEIGNFSYFVCRDILPNLTSRILYGRMLKILGRDRIFSITNITSTKKGGPVTLSPIYITQNLILFNSIYNKDRNLNSLILVLRNTKTSLILSGDCHYYQLSDYVLPILNYSNNHFLIVPHHGGKAGKYKYISGKLCNNTTAVISVGNSYKHPLKTYAAELRRDFVNLFLTRVCGTDITINL